MSEDQNNLQTADEALRAINDYSAYLTEMGHTGRPVIDRFRRATTVLFILALIAAPLAGFGIGIGYRVAVDVIIPRMTFDSSIRSDFSVPVGNLGGMYRDMMFSYADIIAAVQPAVVRIQALRGEPGAGRRYVSAGQGSGMVFYESPTRVYIVTNAHVVQGADIVNVLVGNGANVTAHIMGYDTSRDIAVISVLKSTFNLAVGEAAGSPVHIITFGDSDNYRVGDIVIAIGNALGDGLSSTNGIISAVNRFIVIDDMRVNVIQTNSAINHGNSGGPLVALTGEVIGMNTARGARGTEERPVEGVGYSIPSNDIVPVIERIMRGE
ncbi:MAG: trypsin-like peptidase domain-containing protein [Defluviitaleaceae bacterium]|nr:trypsin-like peptidase domain-containing protein [Defluviitaleaceae bacterium]